MFERSRKYISRKLALGLAGLLALVIEAALDAVLGLPHASLLIQATTVVSVGAVGAQGTIDVLNTGSAKLVIDEIIRRLLSKRVAPPAT